MKRLKKIEQRISQWESNLPLEAKMVLGGAIIVLSYLAINIWLAAPFV